MGVRRYGRSRRGADPWASKLLPTLLPTLPPTLLWLLLCLFATAAQARSIVLAPGTQEASLGAHLRYFHDTTASDDIDTALDRVRKGQFAPVPGGNAAFGFKSGAFWFHTTIVNRNSDEPRWVLVQRFALSDHIDVYARYRDGRVVHTQGGDARPFSARHIPYRHPNFRLEFPPEEPVDLFVRVRSQSSMQVPLDLYTPAAFTSMSRDSQLIIGLYYGILLALFVYNLVLWISLRDANYFWYLFHITAFGLVLFTLNGFSFEYLWPGSTWLADKSVPLSICLAMIGMQQFARTFLEQKERLPAGNVISLAWIAFFVALGIASLWLPYRISTQAASGAVLLGVIWIFIASVMILRRGYAPAKLFLLAWSMFLLGVALIAALAFGLLPKNLFTEYGVQIGSALEMLLLSVALGYRYAALRNENERIVNEANLRLERKVAQRTQELRSALTQLEEAHRRLRDSSRRDGLTGLYNRTYFRDTFDALLAESREQRRPISLLMIDLDHFKSINDRFGHLVGDDCLRWAAQRIGQAVRAEEAAMLARFGGEEFVVVLPGYDLGAAVAVAERLRKRLADGTCISGEHSLRVSASIGVHTVEPDSETDSDKALSVADQALYSAKANGRDCVKTSITAA